MKTKLILTAVVLAVASFAVSLGAETEAEQPAKVEELRQQFATERAELTAQILEKRAELVRLSAQKDVDVEKVKKLVEEITELRTNLQKKCEVYRETLAVIGKGAGLGPAGLGPGRPGIGPGWGAGPGLRQGRGGAPRPGLGFGTGVRPQIGRGWAQVPRRFGGMGGRGIGRGFGPGAGMGPGLGMGPSGQGPFYVDKDNDGVCDYWEGAVPPHGAVPQAPEGEPPAGIPHAPGVQRPAGVPHAPAAVPPAPPAGAPEIPHEAR
jgi:hypothetical protein